MAVMTVMPHGTDWTVEDLEQLPDDGLQYELLDGMLLVSPAPTRVHQRAAIRLVRVLHHADCPPHLEVMIAPLDWQPDQRNSLQPDVLVATLDDPDGKNITRGLVLAVEVLSPSSRLKDTLVKRAKYESGGVTSYWIVDPEVPSVSVYELRDGHYETVVEAKGDETVRLDLPFPVEFAPADLIRR